MSIDLSRVNISLQQFQRISSGKYNAGEVKLASETKLGRVNNHVHLTGSNATPLSHEEVLAVKNAFVKALSSNGVAEDEIAKIRRDLGLSAEAGMDKTLHERSLKPLTRQQVRQILDLHAAAINAHAEQVPGATRIRTSAQIYGEGGMRADRADKRDTVNASLAGARGTEAHAGIALAETVVAGDVDFRSFEESKLVLAQARAQLDQILQRTKGRPDANREAVVEFRVTATGQNVRIPTGRSEAAFVRKLEEMIIRLSALKKTDDRSIAVRTAFGALADPVARREWLDGLGNAPDAGFKVRTAVVLMLTEAGIDDWETLSCINRVDDATALDFARSLVQLNGSLRGDDLRNDQAMQALVHLAAPDAAANVPGNQRAAIPATSPQQWNDGVRDAISRRRLENIPHDIKALLDEVPGHLRRLFGEDIVGLHATSIQSVSSRADLVIPQNLAEPVTAESLRAALFAYEEKQAAETYSRRLIGRALVAAGGSARDSGDLWCDWTKTRPQLKQRLLAAHTAAEVEAVFNEFRESIASDAKRSVAVERNLEKATSFLRDALAARLDVPSACLSKGLDLKKFRTEVGKLGEKIRQGEIPAATDEEVEAAVRAFAEKRAAHYADAFAAVERVQDLPPALRDALLEHVISIDSPQKLDVVQVVAAARARLADLAAAIDAALVSGRPKQAVYDAMQSFEDEFARVMRDLFPPDKPIGGEEICSHGGVLMLTAIFDREGFADRLVAFFARPDVKSDDPYDRSSPAFASFRFIDPLPDPGAKAALASSLGTPDMPPFHAQALMKAFEDAGLGDLSTAARMAVLRPSHPAGAALAQAIAAEPGAVSPGRLRELAAPILRTHTAAGGIALPPADAERMEAALAKYDGGLPAADRVRLRQYAESLDFSEAAAPESEKALARRLDEICGGGAFANPASSASRRALAAGFTLADLPTLAIVTEQVEGSGPTYEEAIEIVLDRQSDFSRRWNAALLRHVNVAGDPERLAALPAEDKIAVAHAVLLCKNDADLLAIVTNGITRAIRDGAGHLRNPVAIQRIVENVQANLAELRETTEDDPAAFAAGLELLKGLETRSAPAGYLKYLLDAVRRAPIDAVSKLRRRSTPAEIHRAILQLNGNAFSILSGRDSGGLAEDGDTALACRHFLLRAMVSRLTDSQRRGMREALASQNAAQTVTFYDAVAANEVDMPQMPLGLHAHLTSLAATLSRDAGFLYGVVRRSLGEADANGQLPPLQGELDLPGIGAQAMFNEIHATARAHIDAAREKYVQRAIPGNSPAATALRGLFATRLANSPSINPGETIGRLFAGTTANMLNLNIVRRAKQLATAQTAQDFALTQFAIDRDRVMDVFLPGGGLLSTNPATAADELARFVTGREDATYATLNAAEKTKVHVVMSLLTQESSTAAIEGPSVALDPEGKTTSFNYGGNGQGLTRSFHLAKSPDGAVTVSFETTLRPTILMVGGDPIQLGAGSEIRGSFSLTFSAEQFNAIGELDFAGCDNAPADAEIERNPPVANKIAAGVNLLPEAFRFNLDPTTSFTAVLN